MDLLMDTWSLSMWVSPFRYPRLIGYLLLPAAFRSLSRLSSALSAKASTLRPFLLNHFLRSYGVPLHLYSVTGFRVLYFCCRYDCLCSHFCFACWFPSSLLDDGLGCLILFYRCISPYCCFYLDTFRFSVFGFQGTSQKASSFSAS